MKRLKNLIEQYGRWSDLDLYINRIETHSSSDFSISLENSKALLESISKEICKSKGIELDSTASINQAIKKAFNSIGYPSSNLVTQISSALATIGQNIGELRNDIGTTAHGKTLEEIKERNEKIDEFTKEFLIDTTVIVASFLIRNFENENPRISIEEDPLYFENPDFNEYWDSSFGEFEMGEMSYTASEILYNLDIQAYLTELRLFQELQEEA
ncbi:abortive infection family protein [bacterium]|nr:abortive infection family protein [bacterium]